MVRRSTLILVVAGTVMVSIAGCPQQTPDPVGNTGDPTALTEVEGDAVAAAVAAIAAINNAGAATQAGADAEDSQTAQSNDCPEVDFSSGASLIEPLTLSIDFGAGCSPAGSDSFMCSGSTTGTVNVLTRSLDVSFDTFSCNGATLAGGAELTFTAATPLVTLTGSFDLDYSDGSTQVAAAGDGSLIYNRDTAATSIPSFAGEVVVGGDTYEYTVTGIDLSVQTFGNLIPFAGEAVIDGADTRSVTVRFDADSPTTGDVEVSVNGTDFFTVNVFEL